MLLAILYIMVNYKERIKKKKESLVARTSLHTYNLLVWEK